MSTITKTVKKTQQKTYDGDTQWCVVFLNDDYTSMEFVSYVLVDIFNHSSTTAEQIMLEIHRKGSGVAGRYTFEIAEQKATETMELARENKFPLNVQVEKES